MATIFAQPYFRGTPLGSLRFYQSGTLDDAKIYSDTIGTTRANPALADSAGRYPAIYLESGPRYRLIERDAAGVTIRDVDPLSGDPANITARNYGAVADGVTDDTAAFQAAIDAAYVNGKGLVEVPPGIYAIFGTIFIKPGVSVVGQNYASEYYPDSPYLEIDGTMLIKPVGGADGPIFEMATASALNGLYLKHMRVGGATTGIVRFGPAATSGECFNAVVQNCQLSGHGINVGGVYAAANCHGIFGPESTLIPTRQRYFNRVTDCYVSNCDRGISLGGQCNGWTISNFFVRQCYRPVYLDGGASEVADVLVTGLHAQCIGVLPTAPTTVFTLVGAVNIGSFTGVSECSGSAFDVSLSTGMNQLDFSGYQPNENIGSSLPFSQTPGVPGFLVTQPNFVEPTARGGWTRTIIVDPLRTTDKYDFIRGMRAVGSFNVSGTLPTTGAATGALVAGSDSSRVVFRFQNLPYKISAHPYLHCRLTIVCDGPDGSEAASAHTEFVYRRTTSTGPGAGVLSVIGAPVLLGASLGGVYFISGKTGDGFFGIAIVGTGATAFEFDFVTVTLEILALDTVASARLRDNYTNVFPGSVVVTADDVTNSVTLMTVGNTTI